MISSEIATESTKEKGDGDDEEGRRENGRRKYSVIVYWRNKIQSESLVSDAVGH